jgi:hypothetical protein
MSPELDLYAESPAVIGVDGLAVAATLPQSAAFSIDRYFRQAPSATGKLAYVIFGVEDSGIYYNWYVYIVSLILLLIPNPSLQAIC